MPSVIRKSNVNNCIYLDVYLELNCLDEGLSKSKCGEQLVEDIPNFTLICVYLFVYLCYPSWPNENDTDLKFGTHTPIDLI